MIPTKSFERSVPDVLLASQFYDSIGTGTLSSEQRLMLALLADGINVLARCTTLSTRNSHNPFNEARLWVFANRVVLISFDDACDALGLSAECLRKRLSEVVSGQGGNLRRLRLKEQGRRRPLSFSYPRQRGNA